jgi:putative ABC transport system permease protein
MKSYLELIPISARIHKKQSRMTLFCIVLAVFLVASIFGMADMELRNQKRQEINTSGNWHVMFAGIDDKTAAMIAARPEVKAAGWYYYLSEKNEYTVSNKTVSVSGQDKNVFDAMFPTMLTEGVFPTKENEVVLNDGAKGSLGIALGDTITLEYPGAEPLRLTVVGFALSTSKMLKYDVNALLLTTEGFRAAFPRDSYTSAYIVQLSEYCNMQKVIADIRQNFGLTDKQIAQNGNLLAVIGQSDNNYVLTLYSVAVVLFIIVLAAGVLMIASSLNSNVMQRTEFFGMMRCLGATKKQIMRFVRLEGLQWCKTAIPLGLGISIIVVWAMCAVLKALAPGYFAEMPLFEVSWIGIIPGIAVGIFSVLLAARAPAKKAACVSPLSAVSGNAGHVQRVRRAANTKLLKIEAGLGLHHATSSRKNFLLMVGSFSLSIILFLCFSATVDFFHHAIKPLKPWTPDISIASPGNTCSLPGSLIGQLRDNPKIKRVYGRMFSDDIQVRMNGRDKTINLISYEDHQFSWAKDSLIEGSVDDVRQKDDHVLAVYASENSLHVGDMIEFGSGDEHRKITVAGLFSASPFDSVQGVETIICSEAAFRKLTGETKYTVIDIQLSGKATDEDVNTIRALAGSDIAFSDRRAGNNEARGSFYSMALCVYGFLVIIAVITIFNIVNSISMSVAARMKQYGAMRAVGMSDGQLVNMVRAEAIIYSAAGSIVGCIVGLPLHKQIFEGMITSHWGEPWQLPLTALGIIVAVVIAASILAVRGPAKRIHNMSIVDTINAQ